VSQSLAPATPQPSEGPAPRSTAEPAVVAWDDASTAAAGMPKTIAAILDPSQRTARRYLYGFALVFSAMLILLVVVGFMLWSR